MHRQEGMWCGWPIYAHRRVLWYMCPFVGLMLALFALMQFPEWIAGAVGAQVWLISVCIWGLFIVALCAHFYLLHRSRAAGPEVPASRLACPRCGHPMEDLDPDTVMCMECGTKGDYRAVKRAWRRVGPLYRPKQARG